MIISQLLHFGVECAVAGIWEKHCGIGAGNGKNMRRIEKNIRKMKKNMRKMEKSCAIFGKFAEFFAK